MKLLFHSGTLSVYLASRVSKMGYDISRLDIEQTRAIIDSNEYAEFVQSYMILVPKLDTGKVSISSDDTQIDVSNRFDYAVFDDRSPHYVVGTRYSFEIPFVGDQNLFTLRPSTYDFNPPSGAVKDNKVILDFDTIKPNKEDIQREYNTVLNKILKYLDWMNRDVEAFNQSLSKESAKGIQDRYEKLYKDDEVLRGLVLGSGEDSDEGTKHAS